MFAVSNVRDESMTCVLVRDGVVVAVGGLPAGGKNGQVQGRRTDCLSVDVLLSNRPARNVVLEAEIHSKGRVCCPSAASPEGSGETRKGKEPCGPRETRGKGCWLQFSFVLPQNLLGWGKQWIEILWQRRADSTASGRVAAVRVGLCLARGEKVDRGEKEMGGILPGKQVDIGEKEKEKKKMRGFLMALCSHVHQNR